MALVEHAGGGGGGGNENVLLNPENMGELNAHWHYSADTVNALAIDNEFRVACFESSNNFIRYWWGVSDYNWGTLTSADETWDSYDRSGTRHDTDWAPHHYGLVSGSNETWAIITSHSSNQWACGGASGPGGEGYTGRGGISNFRMWVR